MTAGPQRPWGRVAVRERLRALLPATPQPAPGEEPPGQRWLAMLLSLVVAFVLWFSFSMRKTSYTDSMEVPVEVVSTPPDVALSEAPPASATVTFQGEGWALLGLARRRPVIRVTAEAATVDLQAELLEEGLPGGVTVQAVQPRSVELAFDTRTGRRLPIRLRRRIETEPGYDLVQPPTLQPDSVSVTGAQSLLGSLSDWPTELLVVEGVKDSFVRRVSLSDTFGGLLVPSVRSTLVSARIAEFTEEVRSLDVQVVNLPPGVEGVRFVPSQVPVTYRLPVTSDDFARAQDTEDFYAVVDYADIARDTTAGVVPVAAHWPQDLDVRDVRLEVGRVEYFILRRAPRAPRPAGT